MTSDAAGGDCPLIGTWDPSSSTCTLTTDLNAEIHIINHNISLDGNGHSLTGGGSLTRGVSLDSVSGVRVTGLEISGFSTGIFLQGASRNIIFGNTISGNGTGIDLFYYYNYNSTSDCSLPWVNCYYPSNDNQIFNNN